MPPLEPVDDRLQQAMKLVLLATVPGLLVFFWLYGWGVLINLILSASTALIVEAGVTRLRRQSMQPTLSDGSALVSATLLALALPPYCPWWLTACAVASDSPCDTTRLAVSRTVPVNDCSRPAATIASAAAASRICRAPGNMAAPASVSTNPRAALVNSTTPSAASSSAMWRPSVGWLN